MFEEQLLKWERTIEIPYPDRLYLLKEMENDLSSIYLSLITAGLSPSAAYEEAVNQFTLGRDDLVSLKHVHAPLTHRLLMKLPANLKPYFESLCGMVPLMIFCFAIQKEVPVMEFIVEGGSPGMYAILVMGAYLIGRELLRMFRIVVVKDHTSSNLNIDTQSVLIGCLALLAFAMAWTALGLYATAQSAEISQNFNSVLVMGIKESLIPVISGLLICSLVMFTHYGTRRILQRWKAPLG